MAVYEVQNKKIITHLFDGWDETMIWSCLQDCMGVAYADSLVSASSAQINIGGFCFFAGKTNYELLKNQLENLHSNFSILVPQNEDWERAIEDYFREKVTRRIRYATKKGVYAFDREKLQNIVSRIFPVYELKMIDSVLYDEILALNWAKDLCINYKSYEEFASLGIGVVACRNKIIVSGASSYTSFNSGIEIEVDTREDERRNGLASACGAKLILECLKQDWYPSWDAHNRGSLALAEKLGYSFDREYPVYELDV